MYRTFAIYVANMNSNTVSVIDSGSDKVLSTILVGSAPYSIAKTSDGKYVFSMNSMDGTVSMIETTTSSVAAVINVGSFPIAGVVSLDNRYLYVACRDSEMISVIDINLRTVIANIVLNFKPVKIELSPDGRKIFVLCINSLSIPVIDTETNTIIKRIALPGTSYYTPTDFKISPDGKTAFFVSFQRPAIVGIDAENLTVIEPIISFSSGVLNPTSVCISPDSNYVFVTGVSKSTGVVMRIKETLPTKIITTKIVYAVPYKSVITSDCSKLIVLNNISGSITIFDTNNLDKYTSQYLGGALTDIVLTPSCKYAYITNQPLKAIIKMDIINKVPLLALPIGDFPIASQGTYIDLPTPPSMKLFRPLVKDTESFDLIKDGTATVDINPSLIMDTEGNIFGLVTDPDNNPISNAEVKVIDKDNHTVNFDYTDSRGKFMFRLVPSDHYSLVVVSPDHLLSKIISFSLASGEQKEMDVKLTEAEISSLGVLLGEMIDENMLGITNGVANLYKKVDGGDVFFAHGYSEVKGLYRIPYIPLGLYTLKIQVPGYVPYESLVIFDREYLVAITTSRLTLDTSNPKGKISGRVLYNNLPVANSLLELYKKDGESYITVAVTSTDESGYYEFKNLPAGTYFIECKKLIESQI
ncbi:40-residue YVTN family beta-propeller repeat-containing protein [Caloramator quimbayensis]|uniref:40-residue YVTN family beta-propeller repeat-containing protein n=1 Tax=Caloramator quimbayensis TaxID=1147123 RepID=A0A1T4Y5U4_9CLOT|nr:carboxypeptidase regulatory-like domain-containing protein [Caloramator quimbayensis]SKA97202.1 40-residue YVTN family beta-propeller repeat-containing protein [Caloramator quimbayensis]